MSGAPSLEQDLRAALGVAAAPPEPSATDVRILDAALALIGEYGERRLTIDDVAEKSKVARRTIFRRFGSKQTLLTRVYHREVEGALERIAAVAAEADDLADVLVAAYLFLLDDAIGHPVIRRLARAEPETLVELWRTGEPSGLGIARMLLRSVAGAVSGDTDVAAACDLLAGLLFAEQLLAVSGPASSGGLRDPAVLRAIVTAALSETTDHRKTT